MTPDELENPTLHVVSSSWRSSLRPRRRSVHGCNRESLHLAVEDWRYGFADLREMCGISDLGPRAREREWGSGQR